MGIFKIFRNNNPNNRSAELSDHELLAASSLVDETLERGFRWLRFPQDLEQVFERETGAARARYMIVSGLLGFLINDIFLFSDYTMIPDVFATALLMRLGIQTPLVILACLGLYRGFAPAIREGLGATVNVFSGFIITYLLSISKDPNSSYYFPGLILVIMFSNIVYRLRFWYAVATSLASIMIYTLVIWPVVRVPEVLFINSIFALAASAVLSIFANYALEQNERHSYLLNLRERIRGAALTIHNIRLTELAHIDSLTGIANRLELDEYLNHLLLKPRSKLLGIAMLDIDQFKKYNDLYGHPTGDECLHRVAGVLSQALRQNSDLLARFGGEEFIVLMPGADAQAAQLVAERMRRAVMNLAIPHEASSISRVVTISAGVAAANLNTRADAQAIMALADEALYRAKSAGRNCVEY